MLVEATCVLGEGSRQAGSGEGRGRHGPYAARNRTCGARRALVNSIAKSCVTRPQPATGVAFLLRLGAMAGRIDDVPAGDGRPAVDDPAFLVKSAWLDVSRPPGYSSPTGSLHPRELH